MTSLYLVMLYVVWIKSLIKFLCNRSWNQWKKLSVVRFIFCDCRLRTVGKNKFWNKTVLTSKNLWDKNTNISSINTILTLLVTYPNKKSQHYQSLHFWRWCFNYSVKLVHWTSKKPRGIYTVIKFNFAWFCWFTCFKTNWN